MDIYILDPKDINPNATERQTKYYTKIFEYALQSGQNTTYSLSKNINSADLIIAPIGEYGYGYCMENLRESSIYLQHGNKLYIYCPDDNAHPFLPGVYPAISKRWVDSHWAVGGHYISPNAYQHRFQNHEILKSRRKYLFSFVGSSRTHKVREKLLRLNHPNKFFYDSNPASDRLFWWQKKDIPSFFKRFREIALKTKFALCPRGVSPSSVRLFEVMEAGCVPVIISDRLVLPEGPNWQELSIRVSEKNINEIPKILEKYESDFESMSRLARKAWENFFSPQSSFHSLSHWTANLHQKIPSNRKRLEQKAFLYSFTRFDYNKRRAKKILKGY